MARFFLPKLEPLSVGRCWRPCRMADALLEAVRGLRLADPELGPKPLLAKLREQQPDLGAGNKEVREALLALKSEATEAAAAALPSDFNPTTNSMVGAGRTEALARSEADPEPDRLWPQVNNKLAPAMPVRTRMPSRAVPFAALARSMTPADSPTATSLIA